MSYTLPEEPNPFEPPRAGIGERVSDFGGSSTDAELIRRAHLSHEASVKSVGSLYYLGGIFGVLGTVLQTLIASGVIPLPPGQEVPGVTPEMLKIIQWGTVIAYVFGTVLNLALGYGLSNFQVWARWTTVVFTVLGLLWLLFVSVVLFMVSPVMGLAILVVGGGINGLILYLMVSPKGGVVFSPEYKTIIQQTPQIKYKTSIIVKILLGLLLFIILLAIVVAIVSSVRR